MSVRRALQYYGRWLRLTFAPANTVFKSSRNFLAFLAPLALIVLTPIINKYYSFLGPRMSEIVSYIPVLLVFVVLPLLFFFAPYRMHEEQEEKIESLNQRLQDRAFRQTQCDAIADLMDEGRRVQGLYAKEGITPTTNEAEVWQDKVRTYLKENFGRASVSQWENDNGLSLPESPRDKLKAAQALTGDPMFLATLYYQSEQSKIHQTLTFRVIRLHELLTRLQDRLI